MSSSRREREIRVVQQTLFSRHTCRSKFLTLFLHGKVEQAEVAYQFAEYYPSDVSGKELSQEIKDISEIVTRLRDPPDTPLALLKYLSDSSDDLCPNLKTAIQVLMTIECSVAGCERCHSKLRLIKTYLRSTMTQRRFQDLALLSIEKERTRELDFSDLVEQFVRKKMRKMF